MNVVFIPNVKNGMNNPNLINYEYKGQTRNRFGRENNEKYTFSINTNVLDDIKNMIFPEDIREIEIEEQGR